MITAKKLMTERPATVRADATIRDAVRLLEAMDVRHLPVLDKNGLLCGMLSDRDLYRVTAPALMGPEHSRDLRLALDEHVATIMSRNIISVGEQANATQIVGLMLENKIGAVPVVNASGALIGIVSYMDVLRHLPMYDE